MKKILSLALIACVILAPVSVTAFAGNEYTIASFGMTVAVPEGLDVVTRDTADKDKVLKGYLFRKADFDALFRGSSAYLAALNEDLSCEIFISGTPTSAEDFNNLGNADLEETALGIARNGAKNYGVSKSGIAMAAGSRNTAYEYDKAVRAGGAKFAAFNCSVENEGFVRRVYVTSVNGNAVRVDFILGESYFKSEFGGKTRKIDKLIKGITFSEVVDTDVEVLTDDVYADEKTKQSFTLPAGWREMNDAGLTDNGWDARFVNTNDRTVSVYYSSEDIWSGLPDIDRKVLSREETDTSKFNPPEFDDKEGLKLKKSGKTTVGGVDYYICEVSVSGDGDDYNFTEYFAVENGWSYVFRFKGSRRNAHYQDFVAMIESFSLNQNGSAPGQVSTNGGRLTQTMLRNLIIIIAGIAAAAALVIFIIVKNVKDVPVADDGEAEDADEEETEESEEETEDPDEEINEEPEEETENSAEEMTAEETTAEVTEEAPEESTEEAEESEPEETVEETEDEPEPEETVEESAEEPEPEETVEETEEEPEPEDAVEETEEEPEPEEKVEETEDEPEPEKAVEETAEEPEPEPEPEEEEDPEIQLERIIAQYATRSQPAAEEPEEDPELTIDRIVARFATKNKEAAEEAESAQGAGVCRNCGNRLFEDELFCRRCGTRVEKQ